MEQATELEFLQYFYQNAGDCMGPADWEIYQNLKQDFMKRFNKELPKGYGLEE